MKQGSTVGALNQLATMPSYVRSVLQATSDWVVGGTAVKRGAMTLQEEAEGAVEVPRVGSQLSGAWATLGI